jgi:hypothetical protein
MNNPALTPTILYFLFSFSPSCVLFQISCRPFTELDALVPTEKYLATNIGFGYSNNRLSSSPVKVLDTEFPRKAPEE